MDRIQPAEIHGVRAAEAFVESPKVSDLSVKSVAERRKSDKIKPLVIEVEIPAEENKDKDIAKVQQAYPPWELPTPPLVPPKILITQPSLPDPLNAFENLSQLSTFVMTYAGKSAATITTPSNLSVFTCEFAPNTFWEGCHPKALEKITRIHYEEDGTHLVMKLRHTNPPCHSCFEEESNRIEVIGIDGSLLATILQKKTWFGRRIDREIFIEDAHPQKFDTYVAHFSWNDASVNFKKSRSGIIVATLMVDCVEEGRESNYVLQFLRDVTPRDKAMLIAFMISRDTLMADESKTREIVERVTIFIIIISFIIICTYFFHPSKSTIHPEA